VDLLPRHVFADQSLHRSVSAADKHRVVRHGNDILQAIRTDGDDGAEDDGVPSVDHHLAAGRSDVDEDLVRGEIHAEEGALDAAARRHLVRRELQRPLDPHCVVCKHSLVQHATNAQH
jgi:hypothetical protein